MILVITDDLSGAAELAGIAFAHGLTAEVQTEFQPRTEAQVICLDTDTRRLKPNDAVAVLQKLARRIKAASPEFIFKKTDSALRGNIGAELGVLLEITARVRAVFVPANPSRGRTIRGGEYWIGDTPLHETDFARDPQHPSTTANVAARLGNDPTITIPDATTEADVLTAAATCDDLVLPAGAGEFFASLPGERGLRAMAGWRAAGGRAGVVVRRDSGGLGRGPACLTARNRGA
ncbi:MAG: four-carbon acid sugar kinase family protein [Nitrospinae bacterium]|nr:four-carbon acid sugar kinase family protein [Nitrospinota bacterium]